METSQIFGTEKISKVLLKMAPPVMLAQLIQALYNIVDSLFIGRYAETGLTALSIIYPIQLLMIALAVGTGVGINTVMAARLGTGQKDEADAYAGVGTPLVIAMWFVFALVCWLIMPAYARMSTSSEQVIEEVIVYGRIVCVFSFGLFLESIWTKVLQANGDMKTPMFAQIMGAITNIVFDPLLIFGMFGLPEMGIAGAAIATVAGQIVAALVVMRKGLHKSPALAKYAAHIKTIFRLGVPNMLMQSAYTFYILGLNLILAGFSDQAVTALGLYYSGRPSSSFRWEPCKPALFLLSASIMLRGTLNAAARHSQPPYCLALHSWRWERCALKSFPDLCCECLLRMSWWYPSVHTASGSSA